jgi:pimeloyl-ACP methyl ester carboxylesterase
MAIYAHVFKKHEALPPLVLVHGLGSAGSIWKMLHEGLEDSFTIYALDLPGHGVAALDSGEELDPQSLARNIVEYLESEHGITTFHVAGNSLGGWITLEMAALFPDRVLSVTALAPAGLWDGGPTSKFPPTIDARILAKISQFFMPLAYRIPALKAVGYKKITHLWRELSYETCRDSVVAMAQASGFTPMWSALRHKNFSSKIPNLVRVSVIFGEHDLTLPNPAAQLRNKTPEHTHWIIVENCPHVIMWNYPKLTSDFIKETALGY